MVVIGFVPFELEPDGSNGWNGKRCDYVVVLTSLSRNLVRIEISSGENDDGCAA